MDCPKTTDVEKKKLVDKNQECLIILNIPIAILLSGSCLAHFRDNFLAVSMSVICISLQLRTHIDHDMACCLINRCLLWPTDKGTTGMWGPCYHTPALPYEQCLKSTITKNKSIQKKGTNEILYSKGVCTFSTPEVLLHPNVYSMAQLLLATCS